MQSTELAEDFRARAYDICPGGVPALTIGEKFRLLRDDAASVSSSASGVGGHTGLPSFLPLGDKACLPVIGPGPSDGADPDGGPSNSDQRAYSKLLSEVVDPTQGQHRYLIPQTARAFNNLIRQHSPEANLVVTHLPIPHKVSEAKEFMEYVDTLFEDIDNMLLIQGTGVECEHSSLFSLLDLSALPSPLCYSFCQQT